MKAAVIILALIMLFIEIQRKRYFYLLIAVFVVLAAFFEKEHKISEKGVDIQYRLFGYTTHNYWLWSEITTLHTDYRKASPNVLLHIGKDIVARTFVMDVKSCQGALKLAKKMNPKIYIVDDKSK